MGDDGFLSPIAHSRLADCIRLESAMVRSGLVEAYARRLVAALSSDLGSRVASVQRTVSEGPEADVLEWKAMLESGVEIRLSAVVLAGDPPPAVEPSDLDLGALRDLGISSEDSVPK